VPDSLPLRHDRTHDINDDEACRLARRIASMCAHCGLIHEDYDYTAMILDGLDRFDCEIYIPDIEKLQMDGTDYTCS
jgi:hypothetical protein